MSKIFCIGSNKTGTTSLTECLKILGYSVCPENIFFKKTKYFEDVQKGNYNSVLEFVKKYDDFEDRPWNHTDFYRILDSEFPDSKFILTVRNEKNWINSYKRWSNKINLQNQPFYKIISQICYGVDDFLSHENLMVKKFVERNQEIKKYFLNTDKLLVIDIEEEPNWKSICYFLNKEIPNINFPHLNRTE